MDFYDFVIIGNGIAGSSLAQYLGNNTSKKIAVISHENNLPIARTALMYVATGQSTFEQIELPHLLKTTNDNLNNIHQKVIKINALQKDIELENGLKISYQKLVIATGAKPKRLPILENKKNSLVFYHKNDLFKLIDYCKKSKSAIIIGSGLIAIEIAEILRYYNIKTKFLIRGSRYWPEILNEFESNIVEDQIKKYCISINYNTTIAAINEDKNLNINSIIDHNGLNHHCDFIIECIGVESNFDIEIDLEIDFEKGILINENFETNIKDVYAIGDCSQPKIFEQTSIWHEAQKSGIDLGKILLDKNYEVNQNIFSNAAKFFNVEFVQWGNLKNGKIIQWQNNFKSFKIAIDTSKNITGLQSLGIRIRSNVAQKMIENKISFKEFLEQIESLNFEPEFNKSYWPAIKTEFKKQYD